MKRPRSKKRKADFPIGRLKAVSDILPPPEELAAPEEMVKVTVSLDRKSLEFFKDRAAASGTKYQRMIRELIRTYATHYS